MPHSLYKTFGKKKTKKKKTEKKNKKKKWKTKVVANLGKALTVMIINSDRQIWANSADLYQTAPQVLHCLPLHLHFFDIMPSGFGLFL